MNARDTLDNASRSGAVWKDRAALRRRVSSINSRARRSGARGQITADELAEKLAAAKGKCFACSKLFGPRFGDRWIICFRVPLSRGGECKIANIGIICRACEMHRAAKLGVKWEGSGRAHSARKPPRGSVPPGPVKSPGTLVFRDEEEEKG
jgi:hypothetical protein